ncbi:hypothetical protein F949_00030 [Acinetobacter junii NIPH 182]|uniref:conjugal transfer pilus assembly protein TraU n=1 Tax=Acinetobacter junii TaxID=40215 RepID=UPI0002CFC55F|nr:conjugal transfer pilus assembly protein TraU [Acinetobacter junii]ENV65131.1 hypothetical protein F949_00030 [Acinetobacter junii NIPH 182]
MMKKFILAFILIFSSLTVLAEDTNNNGDSASNVKCAGEFANPLTDICWSCIFPLSIGGLELWSGGQEDIKNPPDVLCSCIDDLMFLGITLGYWEPARRVDVTRTPYCFVSLGTEIDVGGAAPEGEVRLYDSDNTRSSFYQAHWYSDPILYWLEVMYEHPCLETGKLDIAYMTEIDPLWNDDELSAILAPESNLVANPLAQAACAGDCVLASNGFGTNALFWCAGCQGSIYPFTGNVGYHVSHIQASSLIAQRLAAKMHRQFLTWGTHGSQGLCGVYPLPVMDKTAYKYQMLYPRPQTDKIGGKCCQPFGRTTVKWGAGRSYPVKGEHFSYEMFRKKNCCVGIITYK